MENTQIISKKDARQQFRKNNVEVFNELRPGAFRRSMTASKQYLQNNSDLKGRDLRMAARNRVIGNALPVITIDDIQDEEIPIINDEISMNLEPDTLQPINIPSYTPKVFGNYTQEDIDKMGFNEAFAAARKAGQKTFTWRVGQNAKNKSGVYGVNIKKSEAISKPETVSKPETYIDPMYELWLKSQEPVQSSSIKTKPVNLKESDILSYPIAESWNSGNIFHPVYNSSAYKYVPNGFVPYENKQKLKNGGTLKRLP